MLNIVEKEIRGRIGHAIHRYAKAINKNIKNYNKKIESLYLMYLDVNNLYGWAMLQKLSIGGFKWKNIMLKFNEKFIKNYKSR